MSVPSTLQGTHDECGGTVVFRPATQRRALLAGHRVELHAACRTCGETLSIEWELEEWNEPLVQLDERRAAHAARQPEQVPVTMPMASGGEHWAAAHAATEADTSQVAQVAEPTWQEWEPAPRSSANRIATPPAESPQPEPVHADTPVEHGNIDEFLGRFANRVAQARDNLERMRVELPSAITDEGLRRPALRRAQAPVESHVEPVEAVSEPIARPTFLAPELAAAEPQPEPQPQPEPVAFEPVTIAIAVEPEPEVQVEPVAVVSEPEVEVEIPAEPVEVAPVAPVAPVVAAPVDVDVPAPYELPSIALATPDEVIATPVAEPISQLPLHERVVVASTDADVFGTTTASAADVALDVWGTPTLETHTPDPTPAPVVTQEPVAAVEPIVEPTTDLADAFETPVVDDAALTFADLIEAEQPDELSADRGFDWSDDEEETETPRQRRARAKRVMRERRTASGKASGKASRKPSRTRPPKPARAARADASTEVLAAVATAPTAGPSELRVRMGLPQVAIVVLLAAVAGIAFMKLVSTPEIVPPASTRVTDTPSAATTRDAATPVPEAKVPATADTAKVAPKAAPAATTKVPKVPATTAKVVKPKAAVTPGSTVAGAPSAATTTAPDSAPQVPASPADTAPEATNPTSPSSNPFAPA